MVNYFMTFEFILHGKNVPVNQNPEHIFILCENMIQLYKIQSFYYYLYRKKLTKNVLRGIKWKVTYISLNPSDVPTVQGHVLLYSFPVVHYAVNIAIIQTHGT